MIDMRPSYVKDYKIDVAVKNNRLWSAMVAKRIWTVAELHRVTGINQMSLGKIMNLSLPAMNKWGQFREPVIKLAEFFKCLPEDLYPPQHLRDPLEKNKGSFEANLEEVKTLYQERQLEIESPEQILARDEQVGFIKQALHELTPREERVIRLRFGLGEQREHTLGEVAEQFGVATERIRQIEAKAIRKLKRARRNKNLDLGPFVRPGA